MATALTQDEVRAGDALAQGLEKAWGWFLAFGIISVLFGAVVLSYRHATVFALAYFFGAWCILVGLVQLITAFKVASARWAYVIMGLIGLGVGIVTLGWPKVTLFIVATFLGWVLLLWGIVEIIQAFVNRRVLEHWWIGLCKGFVYLVLAIWALRHPGNALTVLVVVLGISAVVAGFFEIVAAFSARHAQRRWEAFKAELGEA